MNLDFSQLKSLNIECIDLIKLSIAQCDNLVPTSIDTDGSIFNGCGYIDGYRLSSSGALKAQSDTITTGFIPYTQNCTITLIGPSFLKSKSSYHYLMFYDKNFTKLGYLQLNFSAHGSSYGVSTSGSPTINVSNSMMSVNQYGYTTIKLSFSTDTSNVAYFRINANGQGSSMIVATSVTDIKTYNWRRAFINLVPLSIDTDGSIYDGCGYKTGYTLSHSGNIVSQENSIITGFIPATATDKIRMFGVNWMLPPSDAYYYICFYDENFIYLGSVNHQGSNISDRGISDVHENNVDIIQNNTSTIHNVKTDANGVTTFNIIFNSDAANVNYIRIAAGYTGQEMVVTKNEEII